MSRYIMKVFLLHKTIIKQINEFKKHCLWQRSNVNNKKPKVAWKIVCVTKNEGGLGIFTK